MIGCRGDFVSISIFALVHLGTSTTMLKVLVSLFAIRGMSWKGEIGPSASLMKTL